MYRTGSKRGEETMQKDILTPKLCHLLNGALTSFPLGNQPPYGLQKTSKEKNAANLSHLNKTPHANGFPRINFKKLDLKTKKLPFSLSFIPLGRTHH